MNKLYTGSGSTVEIGADLTQESVKKVFVEAVASGEINLGSPIGATLACGPFSGDWETNGRTAYQNMLNAYKEIPNSGIPFMIQTDPHGRGIEPNRWLNNMDKDGMNVINIHLGDYVVDVFSKSVLDQFLARTRQIKNFVSVVGNHEKKKGGEVPSDYDLSRTFATTYPVRKYEGPENCYAVVDGAHNVKVIVLDTNILSPDGGKVRQGTTTPMADWLIGELAESDTDILFLSHWPFFKTWRGRGELQEQPSRNGNNVNSEVQFAMWDLLLARKKKQSGTYIDTDGGSHPYDFTKCGSDLLCALHGHIHEEVFSTQDGLTAYAADWFGRSNTCTFGLIDRLGGKITFWVWNATSCLEPLVLTI